LTGAVSWLADWAAPARILTYGGRGKPAATVTGVLDQVFAKCAELIADRGVGTIELGGSRT
jgi:hypothetical protein